MDINFKGKRALVTGAGKGRIFPLQSQHNTKIAFSWFAWRGARLYNTLAFIIMILRTSRKSAQNVALDRNTVLLKVSVRPKNTGTIWRKRGCLSVGIGRSTAKMLVECGAEVIALSRTQADLDSLKEEVKYQQGSSKVVTSEITLQTHHWIHYKNCLNELDSLTHSFYYYYYHHHYYYHYYYH